MEIVDTTFREGQQSPLLFDTYKYAFTFTEKKKLFEALVKLGVKRFEFFSPIVSKRERQDLFKLKKLAQEKGYKVGFYIHSRVHEKDIEEGLSVGPTGFHFYLNLSDFGGRNYSVSLSLLTKKAVELISVLRKEYPDLFVRFSGEDAFRTPLRRLFRVYDKLYGLVDAFGMPDTVGIATPEIVSRRVKAFKRRYPKVLLEVHFHNDRGFSLINALTAVKCGAELVDTSVWGLGERSGISSTTGVLLNLYLENPAYTKGYNLALCYPLNVLMASILGWQVPYVEPVSLTNRTHIAGVHQGAVLKNRRVYEAIDLSRFGVNKNQLLLGPLSGANLILYYLREIKGFSITAQKAKELAKKFKEGFVRKKGDPEEYLLSLTKKEGLRKQRGIGQRAILRKGGKIELLD